MRPAFTTLDNNQLPMAYSEKASKKSGEKSLSAREDKLWAGKSLPTHRNRSLPPLLTGKLLHPAGKGSNPFKGGATPLKKATNHSNSFHQPQKSEPQLAEIQRAGIKKLHPPICKLGSTAQ